MTEASFSPFVFRPSMHTTFTVHSITAAEARPLRQQILRPNQSASSVVFPGDDAPASLHAGAFVDGELVGIASVLPDAPPNESNPTAWRLRGLATHPTMRRRGVGRELIDFCIAHIKAQNGTLLWCNGRTSARAFYESLGFHAIGAEFVTISGPHYVFRLDISK